MSAESPGPLPSAGRAVSPSTPTGNSERDTVQLTDLSVRAISLYQQQAELTDRLWSYFGTNSALATLASLIAPMVARAGWLVTQDFYVRALLALTIVAFYAFSTGNRQALRVSQRALERIAAQAQAASGIELEVIKPAKALFFHAVVSFFVLAIMAVGFGIAAFR